MARGVSEAEIENVVSSVRDLVSSDSLQSEQVAPAHPTSEKLLLTPSLRVSQRGQRREAAHRRPPATMGDAAPPAPRPMADPVPADRGALDADVLRMVIADIVREEVNVTLREVVREEIRRAVDQRRPVDL